MFRLKNRIKRELNKNLLTLVDHVQVSNTPMWQFFHFFVNIKHFILFRLVKVLTLLIFLLRLS